MPCKGCSIETMLLLLAAGCYCCPETNMHNQLHDALEEAWLQRCKKKRATTNFEPTPGDHFYHFQVMLNPWCVMH